jgi:hypothetical protein
MTMPTILRTPHHFAFATVGLLTLSACSSNGGTATGGGTTTVTKPGTGGGKTTGSTTTGAGGSCGSIGNGAPCKGAGPGSSGTLMATHSVTATIVDETGAPVVGQTVFICGTDICSAPGMTAAGGKVTLTTTTAHMKSPAFKFGDAVAYAEMAVPLSMMDTDFTTLGTHVLATGKLSDKPGAALAPGKDAISGDVTVSIPAGASVGFDINHSACGDVQMFRSVSIPLTNEGPILDQVPVGDGGPNDFKLLYGVSPAETWICPAAKVTVALPSTLGWAPGAAVEFWIMTTDVGQTYAPYGGWAKMSDGAVSADGKSVATVASGGFVYLENFAIRLKT